jgi:hypothetical protein
VLLPRILSRVVKAVGPLEEKSMMRMMERLDLSE